MGIHRNQLPRQLYFVVFTPTHNLPREARLIEGLPQFVR